MTTGWTSPTTTQPHDDEDYYAVDKIYNMTGTTQEDYKMMEEDNKMMQENYNMMEEDYKMVQEDYNMMEEDYKMKQEDYIWWRTTTK